MLFYKLFQFKDDHAGHKRHEKRTCCCNFVNIFSIEPNFCRDVEDIILTNLFFFTFGIVTFWREKMLLISRQKTK